MQRKFPVAQKDADPPGLAKKDTLEFFLINPGWHPPSDLKDDPVLGSLLPPEESRAIQMRLMRYVRQGILIRRKASRGFEYKLTLKGEDRVFYLWDKFGDTNPERELTFEEENRIIELLNLKLAVLESRLEFFSSS